MKPPPEVFSNGYPRMFVTREVVCFGRSSCTMSISTYFRIPPPSSSCPNWCPWSWSRLSLQALRFCIPTDSTMRSSLSFIVKFVIGFAVGGPRPRQLLEVPPKVTKPFGVRPSDFCVERIESRMDPKMGPNNPLRRGNIIGKLVVTTATKVSRTAQDPANCAPFSVS